MSKPIFLVTNFDHGTASWTCWVYTYGTFTTKASGRDEGAAVADAVAKFRTSRGARK